MRRIHGAVTVVLFAVQLVVPNAASARASEAEEQSTPSSTSERPARVADATPQSASVPTRSSPGHQLLRNALIGAAIGGTLFAAVGTPGDCGACGADRVKAVLSGAMYGALIGAAIRIHPSRRASPKDTTIRTQLTRKVKAINVAVRF